ncbi:hypothetical protein ADK17_05340 [Bacillus anthracis]|nr:hypothetical protein ADK17_05340 [Bacillus anthracis]
MFYGFKLDVSKYIQSLKEVFVNLMEISNLQYVRGKFLFPQLFVHYKETIIIFLAAFFEVNFYFRKYSFIIKKQ